MTPCLENASSPQLSEIDELWQLLDPTDSGEADWFAMLRVIGMAHTAESDAHRRTAAKLLSALERPNCWPLLSLLVEVPVCRESEQRLLASMSGVERFSLRIMRRLEESRALLDQGAQWVRDDE